MYRNIPSHWNVFKRSRPTTVIIPRDVHVASDDLQISSQRVVTAQQRNAQSLPFTDWEYIIV